MRHYSISIALLFFVIVALVAIPTYAQYLDEDIADDVPPSELPYNDIAPAAGPKIKSINITGNQRIEEATVLAFLNLEEGDIADATTIDKALSSAFASGLFADVSITLDDNILNVVVIENPIIAEVAFEGNKRINDDELRKEVKLKARDVYTKTDLQHDVKRILDIYQKSGRFSAIVTPKVIQLSQNRVNLVFEIDEGGRSKIRRISFVGNNHFGTGQLQRVIQTKESRWYRFFSSDDNYDPDRLAFDQELLRRYYVQHGYADFRVVSAQAELSPDKDAFYITFTLEEGQRYNFGTMSVESQLPDYEGGDLDSLIETQEGDFFNANLVESTIDAFTKELGNKGYAFVDVDPQYKRDEASAIINIHYLIKEGPRVYVENINISGNIRTLDEVIRREFRLAEGDPYNADKLKRSKQRIDNLGFFKAAEVKNVQGSAADKVDINVAVEEQSTGELTFGAGFSTTEGALGDISILERNLLGRGQYLKLNFTLAAVRQEIDLSFTEPYFMGKDIAAGFDLFKVDRNSDSSRSNLTYDSESLGGVLRGSYHITEHITHDLRYSLRTVDITDIDPGASRFIQLQAGEYSTSMAGHSVTLDTRDNRFQPHEGYMIRLNQDIAGLGGDAKFFRNEVRATYYHPIYQNDWILKLAGKAGHVFGIDEDVRINDRFFIGSNDIRGFANQGIGARDATSLDPLGGNTYVATTVEVGFPLGLPEELGFRGSVFSDAGTLFDTDDTSTALNPIFDESSIRASIGVGVSWSSPLGPIRIDLATPIAEESFDDTEVFKFSFGTRF